MVGDPEQQYGDAWLLVFTLDAKQAQLKIISDKIEVGRGRRRRPASLWPGLWSCGWIEADGWACCWQAEEAARRAIEEEETRKRAEEVGRSVGGTTTRGRERIARPWRRVSVGARCLVG